MSLTIYKTIRISILLDYFTSTPSYSVAPSTVSTTYVYGLNSKLEALKDFPDKLDNLFLGNILVVLQLKSEPFQCPISVIFPFSLGSRM